MYETIAVSCAECALRTRASAARSRDGLFSGATVRREAIEILFFFSSRRRHTRYIGDWSSDVCSSDLHLVHREPDDHLAGGARRPAQGHRGSAAQAEETGAASHRGGALISRCRTERCGSAATSETRSEERRVGKEGRSRSAQEHAEESS